MYKDVSDQEPEERPLLIKVYARRWLILFISCISIFQRGFNQSCYGPINSVFVMYMGVQPYQVDWFMVTQSVVYLSMSLPLSWGTSALGFRNTYILMTSTLLLGFVLTTIGVSLTTGYAWMIAGQTVMGFSNIISWSVPPSTAATWFSDNEVATAVALQVVGQGLGESFGSAITPALVNVSQSVDEITSRMFYLFISVTAVSLIMFINTVLFVEKNPDQPPSEAQAKALIKQNDEANKCTGFTDSFKLCWATIKELFQNPHFVVGCFVFGAVNPVLRNNSILLSSILQSSFQMTSADSNSQSGYVMMGGWMTYTLGGFIAGPIISKTRAYKSVVLFSVFFECLSCMTVMLGAFFLSLPMIFTGVLAQGLFLGMANTSVFELLVEVTYPKPLMLVATLNITGVGIFRLMYPLVGRVLLTYVSATASTAFPFALTLISSIMIAVINPPYRRHEANLSSDETSKLIDSEEKKD